MCAAVEDICNNGELDLTGIDDEELDKVVLLLLLLFRYFLRSLNIISREFKK